ncbi:hypothetical protein ACLIA0_05245 [Bacillaceae bacterium W0354]
MSKHNQSSVSIKGYVVKQFSCVLFLFLFAFIADYYLQNIKLGIESSLIKQLILFFSITIILFVFNQLIYNYANKEEDFMQHKVWDKMFIVIFLWLAISFFLFILLFFVTPLDSLLLSHPWIMFIVVYYFLFFMNLLILSIVHIAVDHSVSVVKKIVLTWSSASLLVALVLFVLPIF